MRTIYFYVYLSLHLLYSCIYIPRVKYYIKHNMLKEKRSLTYKISNRWAKSLVRITGSSVDISGLENIPVDTPVLFASNHQSNFDIPILLGYLPKPIGFVAKVELAKVPLLSTWLKFGDCVFIDRKDIRQSLKAINAASDILKSGHSMVIFPEGTRSKSNELGVFKPGSLKLAEKAGVPIIPITIHNSYEIYEGNNNRVKPANVRITVGKPIYSNTDNTEKSTVVRVYETIKNELEK
ncbi:lysophospholipid acyltransferase family protein [Serpentinicella alkaliphila]|uniref:1-acyl-sn-glycerol-3-phosphate acyltransferase n=1 Tax=Serpentinicella alkaliphila TaxID=1734049 RepID=A0A4R2TSN4_9FIRM|nr:lysophospholipid acyltransferase family protein [Serpentinicella alkaliphila]QUH26973.1 1-acyl-sn-glycerol-3-phosphate acyltransferase [Serpentinicella alkaliphila]TCQ00569.1 1-acyl-sn-glycerol-3-phosphate acyltransferase [Serpentinicella alkaliphila]